MAYAIVQKTLDPPSAEQLRRAFEAVATTLTRGDGAMAARDAFGILVENLSFGSASALHRALEAEGVETEVVDRRLLPTLPPVKGLRRAECLPEGLVLYDALGRPSGLEWPQVVLIAAGVVGVTEFRRVATDRVLYRAYGRGGAMPVIVTDFSDKEEQKLRLVLEIIVEAVPGRYRTMSHEFNYSYLGQRLQRRAADNFVLLVRDLMRLAPQASANRGAVGLSEQPVRTFAYPTRHAFEEEMVWLLYRSRGPRPAP